MLAAWKLLAFVWIVGACSVSSLVAQLLLDEELIDVSTDHTGGYLGTGVSFADFDGDGFDDLSFGHHAGDLKFYLGNGEGFDPIELGLNFPNAEAKGILWADVDNDGDQDLFVAFRLAANKFFLNNGDLTFEDVSATCGIAQDNRRSFGPCFGDYDNDGLLDLFVANYGYTVDNPSGNELYRNLGNGVFEEVTEALGLGGENLQSFQGRWVDLDRDGWLDLHVVRDRFIYPNLFYRNLGASGTVAFEEVATDWGLDVAINCMSNSPSDFDRDGDVDMYLSGGLEGNVLLQNDESVFTDITTPLTAIHATSWSAQWLDVDADGWEELHVATSFASYTDFPWVLSMFSNEPDYLFANNEGALAPPMSLFQSESILSFSTAIGDYNSDGRVDLVSHAVGEQATFYSSQPNENNWSALKLHGTISNLDAVGAQIELWANEQLSYRDNYCGGNYLSQNSRTQFFGLGEATTIDSIRVVWPSGTTDVWVEMPVNEWLDLEEGQSTACTENCAGCTYLIACNFDAYATVDDGTCDFSCFIESIVCAPGLVWNPTLEVCEVACTADFDDDGVVTLSDLLFFLTAFASFCP